MGIAPYGKMGSPLDWPGEWPRESVPKPSAFKVTLAKARDGLIYELDRLGASGVRITSNMALNRDGTFASKQPGIATIDTGVAVWFTLKGEERVLACDQWVHVDDNFRALELTVAAIRGMERWGVRDVVDRAMSGFNALPAGQVDALVATGPIGADDPPWYEVLQLAPTAGPDLIRAAFRQQSREHHPDRGGDRETYDRISRAYERAMKTGVTA